MKKNHQFCCDPVVCESETMGGNGKEWNSNDWRWDGYLCKATQVNCAPSSCKSKQLFAVGLESTGAGASISYVPENVPVIYENGRRDLEKRRRYVEVENDQVNDETGALELKLGGGLYPVTEGEQLDKLEKSGKKMKVVSGATHPVCQVEDCKEDLSNAKDYHRRHKVCIMHSKATEALVGNVMQRFCQQCSSFHDLQEFDEGRRSCRKRLASHNKRRRKTLPGNEVSAATLKNEQDILLHILSILPTNTDETKNKEMLYHLLKTLVDGSGITDTRILAKLLLDSQCLHDVGTSLTTDDPSKALVPSVYVPSPELSQNGVTKELGQNDFRHTESAPQPHVQSLAETSNSIKENTSHDKLGRKNLNNFDLNSVYDVSEDCEEDVQNTIKHGDHVSLSRQPSPYWNSGNSGSTFNQSPSTSSGESQGRTDRIKFKLLEKDPRDAPSGLRKEILDWLSNSPTGMESYIRPGCIILTIYLRMDESTWEELHCNLKSSFGRLLDSSNHTFWRTGWIYTRVKNRVIVSYNGQVVMDMSLPMKDYMCCKISSIKPIAVTVLDTVKFEVRGFNLYSPTSRMLCALEGKYLFEEKFSDMAGGANSSVEHNEIQSISFSAVLPNIIGRGFIEVEDHGLSSSFFPFIVAEKDVCTEIRTLEIIIEAIEDGSRDPNTLLFRNQALDFLNEMGWLFHRSNVKLRLGETASPTDLFPFRRFRWLIEFSIDRGWCAVVKKLLSILVDGNVDSGQHNSVFLALLDVGLLHRAVRRNCRSIVEFLLKYNPHGALEKIGSESEYPYPDRYLFRPDSVGPEGLTPIHIAASLDDYDNILDALTEDPGQVGIEAWKNVRDTTGLTPHDYACIRGHYSYIHLVQRKLDNKSKNGHVMLDIRTTTVESTINQKINNSGKAVKFATFNTEANMLRVRNSRQCGPCQLKLAYESPKASLLMYRPAMISLVLIAAVCVCAALLFKSSPNVLCSRKPFRWDSLDYGSQ